MTQSEQIRYLQIANHITLVVGIVYAWTNPMWIVGSILVGLLLGVLGINIGFHRYLTHSSFETYPIVDKIILVAGTLCLVGTPLMWTVSHVNHHVYADKDGDPYSPSRLTLWDFLMTHFEPVTKPTMGVKIVMKNKTAMWLHHNYFKVIGVYCAVLMLIDPMLVIYGWCIPSLVALYILLVTNIVCHLHGYRNFETNDKSHNNIIMSIITLGEGWHNNHHSNTKLWNQQIKWWELDPTAWIIYLIKK